jgi:tRNA-specific 2-thiouridylase
LETEHTRYSRQVLAHLASPVGVGRLESPHGIGQAGSVACGDLVRIELAIDRGVVEQARFLAYGCPATIAGASEVVAAIQGRSFLEAASLGNEEVALRLDLPSAKLGCSNIAADALHAALEDALRRADLDLTGEGQAVDPRGVLVGMSGGVDSTVAVLQLLDQGFRVVGVTFRLWSDPVCATGRTCCSPQAIQDARGLAHRLGIPHLTIDLSERFYREVVEYFVEEYSVARTPNPCVRCNAALRFEELSSLAERLGLAWTATGHYARLKQPGGRLLRGLDSRKDQSYVLSRVPPELLTHVRFPLGDMTKPEARALARRAGLAVHDSPESQEICFVPDDDYRRFLRERLGDRPGELVTGKGDIVGQHRGLYNFTVGQRKGLGLSGPHPYYVVALRAEEDRVVVGSREEVEVGSLRVQDLVRHQAVLPATGEAQLRSTGGVVAARIEDRGPDLVLQLDQTVRGVAPGQTAVIYEAERVLAAGTIVQTWC